MPLTSGTKLGPYEIVSSLGAGGMGEVYRAKDTRLGREVALKILPESFASDPERLRRFEQEARAVAALNHPNILAIHDIGTQGDGPNAAPFLVSELLEGETLRAVLDRGALAQRKTIEYGVQIAHGLAAAHEKSIVHRDLKPENIFVTKDGRIKILDFGLAKLVEKPGAAPSEVTLTSSHTAAGVVMGTASYMAPEQVRGEPADPRTDIFALGAVLYEMASGTRAFRRDTAVETMTAVLKDDPPEIADSVRLVSPAFDRIVRRCLEKSPEQRFQSARDLSFALSALSGTESTSVGRAAAAAVLPRPMPWKLGLAGLVALAAVAGATWWLARRPVATTRMQFAIPVPSEMNISHMALSRDGSMLVFVSPEPSTGLPMLYVQRIGSSSVMQLPGTQNASFPFWSPDGAYIAFFADGKLEKMPVSSGPPQVLGKVLAARGGSWGSKNVIIYSPDTSSALWQVNADGSGDAPFLTFVGKEEQTHRWPVFLPDGEHFLYWGGNFSNSKDDRYSGIYLGTLKDKTTRKLVVLCHSSFGFDSQRLYFADDQRQLVSMAFDPSTGAVSGSPVALASAVGFQPSTYWTALTVSENGTVVYNTSVGAALSVLTWMDRSGKELGKIGEPGVIANPALSPDGGRVVVDIADLKANNVDLWVESTTGGGNARFTFDPAEETTGLWSPDGRQIAYRIAQQDGAGIFVKSSSGMERDKTLMPADTINDEVLSSWSPDGRQILYTEQAPSHHSLKLLPVTGGPPVPFHTTKNDEIDGQISLDGKWVAYASDESSNWEVYVTSFPGAAGKWQVSRGGGSAPRWRSDGKEIFYVAPNGMLMAVSVSSENGFSTAVPVPLFQIRGRAPISSTDAYTYDVAKDGKRFLVNRYVSPDHVAPLTILLNAAEGSAAP